MKFKVFLIITIFTAIGLTCYFFYKNESGQEIVRNRFFIEDNYLFNKEKQEKFTVKGLVYSPYYPGETGGEDLPNDERYFNHLKEIKSLGLNSLSVFPQKMPANFFSALEENDLFYAQIINLRIYDGKEYNNLLSEDYQEKIKNHIFEIIDHNYLSGQIDRLIYFSLGYEIDQRTISQTNTLNNEERSFVGQFISLKNRQPAEIALAKLLDAAMVYESEKYNHISLYTHISFPGYGLTSSEAPLHPDFFDLFAINIYPSYFYGRDEAFLSPAELPKESGFFSYFKNLLETVNKPVIITELGLPSIFSEKDIGGVPPYGNNSESDVSAFFYRVESDILKIKDSAKSDNFSGLFVFEFMDEWWKNGEEEGDAFYHNPDDKEEWFGVYSVASSSQGFLLEPKKLIIEAIVSLFSSL